MALVGPFAPPLRPAIESSSRQSSFLSPVESRLSRQGIVLRCVFCSKLPLLVGLLLSTTSKQFSLNLIFNWLENFALALVGGYGNRSLFALQSGEGFPGLRRQ